MRFWLQELRTPELLMEARGAGRRPGRPEAAGGRDWLSRGPVRKTTSPRLSLARNGRSGGPTPGTGRRSRLSSNGFGTRAFGRPTLRVGRSLMREAATDDYWQAGKSVAGIDAIEPAGEVVRRFAAVMRTAH